MSSKPTIYIIGTGGTIAGAGLNSTSVSYKSGQINTKKLHLRYRLHREAVQFVFV